MIQVVVVTLVATSSAFTTHRYDAYDDRRPVTKLFSDIFAYGPGDAKRLMHSYETPRRHNDVREDVYNQPPGFNRDGASRRLDTHYNYLNPYQWSNREVPWSGLVITERPKIINRLNVVNRSDSTVLPSTEIEPVEQQNTGADINQTQGTNNLSRTQVNTNDPQFNIQSGDVNRTLVINEQQITWNNEHNGPLEDNANITTRSIHSNSNYSNSLHFNDVPSKPELDKQYNSIKTNNKVENSTGVVQNNITDKERSNKTHSSDDKIAATNRTDNNVNDDVWIWSNGEDPKVETVTVGLDDRAAFEGVGCPDGKVKVGNMCVAQD